MTEFKVGDRVRVRDDYLAELLEEQVSVDDILMRGQVGTISILAKDEDDWYTVSFDPPIETSTSYVDFGLFWDDELDKL